MKLYSMKDKVSGLFGPVMAAHNHGMMTRLLEDQLRGSKTAVELHPHDFELYCLGEFGDSTGEIEPSCEFVCPMTVVFEPKENGHA